MQPRWTLLAAQVLCVIVPPTVATFISRTSEVTGFLRGEGFCLDPKVELSTMQPFDFSFYARRPLPEPVVQQLGAKSSRKLQAPVPKEKLESIYHAPLIMSSKQLEEGISNFGDTKRLERTMWKLENAWGSRLFHWIQMTFPNPNHVLMNKAVPAVTSAYIAPCVLNMVPENTDLIIMEFTFNDAERSSSLGLDDPTRRGMERLMRKLLRMSAKPALLYLHFCPFPRLRNFWDGAEDHIDVLMKFYGVPALSMRNSLHTMMDTQPALLDQIWWPMPSDRLHPTCVGTKFMADQVIGHLQDMAAYVLKTYLDAPQAPHPEVLNEVLRQPIFQGNHAEKPETCILDDQFRALVVGGHGWHWINEGKLANKPKWGFVSTTVGSQLLLKVPLAGMMFPDNKLLIALGVLMTYEHMGYARIDCTFGCVCPPRELNTLHPFKFSMTYWKPMNVTLAPGSMECDLAVTNSPKTKSNEHKLKVTSVMISGELGFVESWTY